jgi:hypothetical protein
VLTRDVVTADGMVLTPVVEEQDDAGEVVGEDKVAGTHPDD